MPTTRILKSSVSRSVHRHTRERVAAVRRRLIDVCLVERYRECGCINPHQWSVRSVNLFASDVIVDAPLCNISNPCYLQAADRLMKVRAIWRSWCADCTQECQTMDFGLTLSSMVAPVDWMFDEIRAFVENSSIPLPSDWATAWRAHVQSNYIAIEIIGDTLQLEKLTQQATLSSVDVLSNVGGHSGLWIGISFLSLMELAEMLYRLGRSNFHLLKIRIREKFGRIRSTRLVHRTWTNSNVFN